MYVHDSISLDLFNLSFLRKQFQFRFENTWLKEPNFHTEVSYFKKLLPTSHLLLKLVSVSSYMSKWGRNFIHKFKDKIKKQKLVLDELVNGDDIEGIKLSFEEKEKLNELLVYEETYWKQRAKSV